MSACQVHGPVTVDCDFMPAPLESNFLAPNGTFVALMVLVVLALLVVGLLVGGLVWLVINRRGTTLDS